MQDSKKIITLNEVKDEKLYILRYKHEEILELETQKIKDDFLTKFKNKE